MPRHCLPATLFSQAIGSRALAGSGPAGVAGLLRRVLQCNALKSFAFSRSQHLQRLQRPLASRRHMRWRERARAGASTRGFGPVASVASVADDKSIYISMVYLQRPLQRDASAAASGVAAGFCSVRSAVPPAIKYPRIFKGLGGAELPAAETAENGVLGLRAAAFAARGADPGQSRAEALDLGETARFRAPSQSQIAGSARERVPFQRVGASAALVATTRGRVAACRKAAPPLPAGGHPPASPRPLFPARFSAPAPGLPAFPGRSGENADRWGGGARGSGAPRSGSAKTGVPVNPGSGEVRDG